MVTERLKELRIKAGISQEKLGKIVNVSQQAVGKWEKGIAEPDSETLKELADYFNVSIDYLLGRTNLEFSTDEKSDILFYDKDKKLYVVVEMMKSLTSQEVEDVKDYIEFINTKKKKK